MSLIGTGVYSLSQAARLVHAERRSVCRWLLGYSYSVKNDRRFSPPLWQTQLSQEDLAEPAIGFKDLLELRLVKAFSDHGVSLQVIRATADAARDEFETAYPLTSKKFLTDGKTIFLEAVERSGETKLVDLPVRQFVFSEVIKPSLYSSIEFEGNDARRWYPGGSNRRAVVLDPTMQFGAPIVVGPSIPTDTLYASYLAEGRDKRLVARIFDVDPGHVDAAVKFEESLAP